MWALPVALIGGIFLACKLGGEAASASEHRRKVAEWRYKLAAWTNCATNDDIEERHEYRLKTAANYRHIQSEINRICPCIPEEMRTTRNYLRVLLSQRGKIPRVDTISGIDTPLIPCSMPMLIRKQKRIAFNDYIRWLDAELRKHGMQERMIFEPVFGASNRRYYELHEVDALGMMEGRFIWVPQSLHYHLDTTA